MSAGMLSFEFSSIVGTVKHFLFTRALFITLIATGLAGCSSKTNDPGPPKTSAELLNGKWLVVDQRYGDDPGSLVSEPLTSSISVIFTQTGANSGTYTYDEVSNIQAAILAIDNGTWHFVNDATLQVISAVSYNNTTNKVESLTSNAFVLLFPAQSYSYTDASGKVGSAAYKELTFKRIN